LKEFRHFARWLTDLALQTDKGLVLATSLIQQVRKERIVLPPVAVIERICAQAITRANRIIFTSLTKCLDGDLIVRSLITFCLSVLTPTPLSSLGYDRHPVHQAPSICLSTLIASKPSRRWISRKADGTKFTRIGC
jgi:hypothetical protein